jgi:glycosyltransferase involved in cell wall biosynthesis
MEKFFSAKINYFVALSNEARTHYINEGINSDKIKVIYDGIDLSSFETNCSNGNISKKVLNAVCIGSLCDRKGQDLCIKAFAEVKKSVPESRLLFVGNGPSESKLRSLVTKFSLEDSVTFLGYMDNIASVMQESHIGILASRREGLPNSVMEYMANGLPVIVSELPGIRELVIEGKSGYIFPQENHLILAKYWIQLLKDTQLRKVMGEAGLKRISDTRFSLQTEMKQIVNLISMVGQ